VYYVALDQQLKTTLSLTVLKILEDGVESVGNEARLSQ
jgi:hypothetical protein